MNNFLPNFNFNNIDNAATNLLCCPDQFVSSLTNGTLSARKYESISYYYDKNGKPKYNCGYISRNKIIAVILESPHKDEYSYRNGVLTPEGPLIGSWASFSANFVLAFHSAFPQLINRDYDIYFLNAVQYQCSLGKPLSGKKSYQKQKNKNVINSWYAGFKDDLIERLQAIKPSYIINLSGKSMQISKLVDDVLKSSFKSDKCKIANGNHPSRWKGNKETFTLLN